MSDFIIKVAGKEHLKFAENISAMIEKSSQNKKTGLAKRAPDYIKTKILEDKAIIAIHHSSALAGFCYIETWEGHNYVANSGLIVANKFRKKGLAKKIKKKIFEHSRSKFPGAKIFGLTTSLAVMKINADLGYKPVTFTELTTDENFWAGCQSCANYDILCRTKRQNCICTGMLFDPDT